MAMYSAVMSFTGEATQKASPLTVASTAELVLGQRALFALVATGDCQLKFGNSGMAAASAVDFFIPAKTIVTFGTTNEHDRIRVFNPTAATIDVYVQELNRF